MHSQHTHTQITQNHHIQLTPMLFCIPENNDKTIVTKPLLKNNDRRRPNDQKKMVVAPIPPTAKNISEKDAAKPAKGRGNCYIEPTQLRDNCVVSELYLIT